MEYNTNYIMSDYYENIGEIRRSHPMPDDGRIRLPESALSAIPYRLENIPFDEIVFVDRQTVTLDVTTKTMQLDTKDFVMSLPTSETRLRDCPAVMRVICNIGDKALQGFLVDYRYIGFPVERDYGLSEGIDGTRFQGHAERYGTTFPLGVLMNNAGQAEYIGEDAIRDSAEHMMQRVDAFVAQGWPKMSRYTYSVPYQEDAIKRPADDRESDTRQHIDQEPSESPADTNQHD